MDSVTDLVLISSCFQNLQRTFSYHQIPAVVFGEVGVSGTDFHRCGWSLPPDLCSRRLRGTSGIIVYDFQ